MTLTHAIIIRLYFAPDDPRAAWRLDFFEQQVLPCLARQTCPDFAIWISCHPAHQERLQALDPRIRTYQDGAQAEDQVIGLIALAPGKGALPQVAIQTRHDSDDLLSKHYVARIRKEIAKRPDKSLLVSFQPYKLDLASGQRYRLATRYHRQQPSMFLSLYQPDQKNYRYIYECNHRRLWQICPRVVTVPEGYCDLVVHGGNCHTKIGERDRPLIEGKR